MSRRAKGRATKGLPRQTNVVEGAGISIEGSSFAAPIILRGDKRQNITLMVSTHPDDDHHHGSEVLAQAQISRKFHGGELPTGGTADVEQDVDHRVFVSFNYDNLLEHASRPSPRQQVVRQLPTFLAIPTLLLSKDGRDEVLADLLEWYDELAKTRGICCARFFVAGKLLSAIAGQALKITDRIARIVTKVWGRQKG
jgi:hypothetical protein